MRLPVVSQLLTVLQGPHVGKVEYGGEKSKVDVQDEVHSNKG